MFETLKKRPLVEAAVLHPVQKALCDVDIGQDDVFGKQRLQAAKKDQRRPYWRLLCGTPELKEMPCPSLAERLGEIACFGPVCAAHTPITLAFGMPAKTAVLCNKAS